MENGIFWKGGWLALEKELVNEEIAYEAPCVLVDDDDMTDDVSYSLCSAHVAN
jgi:hypothetical protein